MDRTQMVESLKSTSSWDFIVIGGGASGLGVAVDTASRGYKTILFESVDFAKGTSSRSTKLAHGGVRYLAKGDIKLVIEALRERGLLSKNASHLFKSRNFIIPNYSIWKGPYFAIGLKLYDLLSGRRSLGKSRLIGKKKTLARIPTLNGDQLKSGVIYRDGQFDDSRLAINLAQTAVDNGASVINYMKVIDVLKNETGQLTGVKVEDKESGLHFDVFAKIVINATGVFANKILKLNGRPKKALKVVPSQGIHLVLDREFLPGEDALMIPKTSDGRVLFAIPWYNRIVLGTTDTMVNKPSYEPRATVEEIDFILETAGNYLTKKPRHSDVRSVYAGLRPLVAPEGNKENTKEISRGHQILISETGLISILGGKWTTYREMAKDIVDTALKENQIDAKPCVTKKLSIHGNTKQTFKGAYSIYGSDAIGIKALEEERPELKRKIHADFDYTLSMVVWAVKEEMARTVEDVLARRTRMLFLDASAAINSSAVVARTMAPELGKDEAWISQQIEDFATLARQYIVT
ncbi:MAG: glycerol-3-phosphate dehydrogenase/oxidase [Bacteroidia bacterium]|nr:glycerol-3-phosphate dehydrogenase/oxidase [Bacteroidia bacterium]MBT8287979.1 glycerol-3-phosphate dehydrogenase/oxidase [Bacteroidia bacterium]NNK87818.1 glycerol-3-phosphate dehydrogenase/oxidase [Flavobacteriaceae bacterium]